MHTQPGSSPPPASHDDWQHIAVMHRKRLKQPTTPVHSWSTASQQKLGFHGAGVTSPVHAPHALLEHVCVPSLQMPTFSVPCGPS
jgi:hypothetical protein